MPASLAMRAARVRGGRSLHVEELPLPEPGPGEARVRIDACGICGTDLRFFHDGLLADGQVPGHEIAGTVERLGPGSTSLAIGQRVAVEPILACGECAPCREGRANVCRGMRLHGIHVPGGFAEYLVAPAARLFPVDPSLSARLAALCEPVAVAIHGLRRGGLEKGQRVLVLGAGSVGLVTALAARWLGAGEVWVSARHRHQAELAERFGAARVLGENEALPDALDRRGRERDIDLAVETVGGGADTLRAACAAVRPGGRVSVLGVFTGPVSLDPLPLLLKEVTLAWSNCYEWGDGGARPDFADAAQLVADERERLAEMCTHEQPLAEIERGFQIASDRAAGAVKVHITPGARAAGDTETAWTSS